MGLMEAAQRVLPSQELMDYIPCPTDGEIVWLPGEGIREGKFDC